MNDSMILKDTTANPAPLGLMGFGMTTVLLNLHNANLFSFGSMIVAMGIFYGGIAQVIAGVMEWKKGNTFATVAFISYGMFWLTLAGLKIMPVLGWISKPELSAMVAYLIMWGIFTAVLFLGTLKISKALQVVFGSLTILFFLLALGDGLGNSSLKIVAGYEGVFCGFSAIYAALAQVINEVYGKELLPLGIVKK